MEYRPVNRDEEQRQSSHAYKGNRVVSAHAVVSEASEINCVERMRYERQSVRHVVPMDLKFFVFLLPSKGGLGHALIAGQRSCFGRRRREPKRVPPEKDSVSQLIFPPNSLFQRKEAEIQ